MLELRHETLCVVIRALTYVYGDFWWWWPNPPPGTPLPRRPSTESPGCAAEKCPQYLMAVPINFVPHLAIFCVIPQKCNCDFLSSTLLNSPKVSHVIPSVG
jgi:hypothetical protein